MFRDAPPAPDDRRSFLVAGIAACAAIAIVDITSNSLVLVPLLVLAPLITCSGGTRRATLGVAVLSFVVAIPLGWIDDVGGTRRHWVGLITTLVGGALAVVFATNREEHEGQLAASQPIVRRADRLKAALATGRMGEWSWDRRTGTVTWDPNTAMLFGVDDGSFRGTYEAWIELVDERDREMVDSAVAAGIAQREPFRFDHRCRWADGTVHWIEGIGEVIVGDDDEISRGIRSGHRRRRTSS